MTEAERKSIKELKIRKEREKIMSELTDAFLDKCADNNLTVLEIEKVANKMTSISRCDAVLIRK